MSLRRVPVVVGALSLAAGVVVAIAGAPSLPAWARTLPFVLAVVAGGVVAALGLLVRSAEGPETEPLPDPSEGANARVPGAAVDRTLAGVSWRESTERAALADRVERVAVATLTAETGCSPATAREQIADGSWTDDDRAAALLADGRSSPGLDDHLLALVTGETPFQRDAARAVAALRRVAGDE